MNSQLLIVFVALAIALLMAFKPEMFVLNPDHRTPRLVRSIKYIGLSVSIVFIIWLILNVFFG